MPTVTKPYGDFTNNVDIVDAVKVNGQINTLYTAINGGLDGSNVTTLGDVTTLTTNAKNTAVAAINEINAGKPGQTTANLTYYVDTVNGNDSNAGTSAGVGNALKTIQAAINKLPQHINHTVIINAAAGTYAEVPNINGFVGKGSLTIQGGANLTAAPNYSVIRFSCFYNTIGITIQGFNQTVTNNYTEIKGCIDLTLDSFKASATNTQYGVQINTGFVRVQNSQFDNQNVAIRAVGGAKVLSSVNAGTGNTTGLAVFEGAVIAKLSTQPAGTTAESQNSGGVIR